MPVKYHVVQHSLLFPPPWQLTCVRKREEIQVNVEENDPEDVDEEEADPEPKTISKLSRKGKNGRRKW